MRCRIDTGPRHPDEDAEYLTPEEEAREMTYKYFAFIRNGESRRNLEQIHADFRSEARHMAELAAERLMISGDITRGADIRVVISSTGLVVDDYHWPQLPGAD